MRINAGVDCKEGKEAMTCPNFAPESCGIQFRIRQWGGIALLGYYC